MHLPIFRIELIYFPYALFAVFLYHYHEFITTVGNDNILVSTLKQTLCVFHIEYSVFLSWCVVVREKYNIRNNFSTTTIENGGAVLACLDKILQSQNYLEKQVKIY